MQRVPHACGMGARPHGSQRATAGPDGAVVRSCGAMVWTYPCQHSVVTHASSPGMPAVPIWTVWAGILSPCSAPLQYRQPTRPSFSPALSLSSVCLGFLQAVAANRMIMHCCVASNNIFTLDAPTVFGVFLSRSSYISQAMAAMAVGGVKRLAVLHHRNNVRRLHARSACCGTHCMQRPCPWAHGPGQSSQQCAVTTACLERAPRGRALAPWSQGHPCVCHAGSAAR